ncbi:hypothetical protein [Aliikangiella coralliicola]|uniref:Uncharacterized protein n=1 Tax=Aliikangiella coralliicola TaxID=2592383 RepID=A0A545U4F2_9GAMM|nr:hypothetical protein [Aliikangiella coralliicola]TQV84361.1 hypothetical protein FLL46_22310 [Aliikangiella coralliicola]
MLNEQQEALLDQDVTTSADQTETTDKEHCVAQLNTLINANWTDYYQALSQLAANYQIPECLKLLNAADEILNQADDPANASQTERYLIGGVKDAQTANQFPFDTQILGNMESFASFKKLLRNDPAGIAKLLKIIPKTGPIDGWHFMQFIDSYQQLFAANGFKQSVLFPATRLLSMKRPDQFVAISEATADTFYSALKIKPLKKQDFQRYWDEIITAIHKTDWFQTNQPTDPAQLPFHRGRMALLERFAATPAAGLVIQNSPDLDEVQTSTEEMTSVPAANHVTDKPQSHSVLANEYQPKVKKAPVAQPKKMTIDKRKTAKTNIAAATKLMSQYYFANKEKFAKVNVKAHRESIIQRLVDGESVAEVFESLLN